MIRDAITDAHHRGLSENDVYRDSRSALRALYNFVLQLSIIAEIKYLSKLLELRFICTGPGRMWGAPIMNVRMCFQSHYVPTLCRRGRESHMPSGKNTSTKPRLVNLIREVEQLGDRSKTHEIFPRVTLRRRQVDYYANKLFSEHGTFGNSQACFFPQKSYVWDQRKHYLILSVCMRILEAHNG